MSVCRHAIYLAKFKGTDRKHSLDFSAIEFEFDRFSMAFLRSACAIAWIFRVAMHNCHSGAEVLGQREERVTRSTFEAYLSQPRDAWLSLPVPVGKDLKLTEVGRDSRDCQCVTAFFPHPPRRLRRTSDAFGIQCNVNRVSVWVVAADSPGICWLANLCPQRRSTLMAVLCFKLIGAYAPQLACVWGHGPVFEDDCSRCLLESRP